MATSTTSSSSSSAAADDKSPSEDARTRARDTSVNTNTPTASTLRVRTTTATFKQKTLAPARRDYPHPRHQTQGGPPVHRDYKPRAGGVGVVVRNGDETKRGAAHAAGSAAKKGLGPGVGQGAGTLRRSAGQPAGSAAARNPRDSLACARRSAFSRKKAGSAAEHQGACILGTDDAAAGVSSGATATAATAASCRRYEPRESNLGETEVPVSSSKFKESSFGSFSSPAARGSYRLSTVVDDDCGQFDSADNGVGDDCELPTGCGENDPAAGELTQLGLIQNFRNAAGLDAEAEGGGGGGGRGSDVDDDNEEEDNLDEEEEEAEENSPRSSNDSKRQGFGEGEWGGGAAVGDSEFPAGAGIRPPQYRRLESRRGSSVTFILPAHVSSGGDNSSQSSSRLQSIATEEGAQLQESYSASLYARRMSAPELPPIADRERHRPPSRSNSKSSLNQLTNAVGNKNFYTRLANGGKLPRNHSDSSLKGMLASSQGPQSSGSVSSYPSGGFGGRGTPGAGDRMLPPPQLHRCASRALSWCATDNSAGSIPKLETLVERKNPPGLIGGGGGSTGFPVPGTPPPPPLHVLKNSNNNNINGGFNFNNNNNFAPPRSVSVNGLRRNDAQELAKIKSRKKRLQSECGAGEIETLATIEQFGHLKMTNGMRRVSSENKLTERKKNVRNARLNSSRHLSVSRTDKLTDKSSAVPNSLAAPVYHHHLHNHHNHHHHHHKRTSRHGSTISGTKGMRRVSSVSAINNLAPSKTRTRIDSNQDSENVETPAGGSEDSEDEEDLNCRIREWLRDLEYADDPPDPVIEYADDPPQTDTAVHIVYNGES